jgi:hypothetical protein
MIRISLVKKDGKILSKNFASKENADMWLLKIEEQDGIKLDADGKWIGLFREQGKIEKLKKW